ncbi:hypothetical protein FD755_007718 [Muntiacus reevesi]|uniref:Endonuclease/exonuclease/phosphatase domain-containing protein n=1 Tax=Muntiacus reevesi TaxID=9886 RepID=A0A5J5MIE7_MUNRE|nr:hypothetical protein FD755_007718 [Muntiacus reevesi]
MVTRSSLLVGKSHGQRSLEGYSPWKSRPCRCLWEVTWKQGEQQAEAGTCLTHLGASVVQEERGEDRSRGIIFDEQEDQLVGNHQQPGGVPAGSVVKDPPADMTESRYPTSKVRGSSREELPHVQGKRNPSKTVGTERGQELPRSVGAQYAPGDQWRNNSRKNEEMEPKQKQHPVVDVTGDRSKVRCCKEQYCIGTWNVRSMNQGKLEVVRQEMARVNVDILGIRELRWTGMGEFNSDDHYIYYCGQESLRRNGVAIIVNNRVQNAVLGCNLKNDRMISVRFQGKPFHITVIQVYAPTSNAEEAEIQRFYEDLQDLLELTPKKYVLFIIGDWNAKVGTQETPGVTGKFGLGVQNEAGQRLIEFCQENTLVIANTLFQQHKRRLYTWTSPDGRHRNLIDYILCSQRWRSSIQSAKTRLGADCGSDHELLVAKFRLKLKKVGKTTTFSCEKKRSEKQRRKGKIYPFECRKKHICGERRQDGLSLVPSGLQRLTSHSTWWHSSSQGQGLGYNNSGERPRPMRADQETSSLERRESEDLASNSSCITY